MNENQNKYVDINAHDNYPDSEQKIEIPTMKVIPLKKICMTIGELPTSYLETMTYYEMLVWFIEYLKNNIIPTVNGNGEAVEELQNVVMSLQNYINKYKDSIDSDVEELEDYMNNYFENLDVQEEINNKLDAMVEDGTLENILAKYIVNNLKIIYNSLELLKQADLSENIKVQTLGYYSINDGGGANYIIRNVAPTGYYETLNNGKFAELIPDFYIKPEQFGAYGDNIHDDTNAINNLLEYIKNHEYKLIGENEYKIENSLIIDGTKLDISINKINYVGNNSAIIVSNGFNNIHINNIASNGSALKIITPMEHIVQNNNITIRNAWVSGNGIELIADNWGILDSTITVGRIHCGSNKYPIYCYSEHNQQSENKTYIGQVSIYGGRVEGGLYGVYAKSTGEDSEITALNLYNLSLEGNTNGVYFENVQMSMIDNPRYAEYTGNNIIWKLVGNSGENILNGNRYIAKTQIDYSSLTVDKTRYNEINAIIRTTYNGKIVGKKARIFGSFVYEPYNNFEQLGISGDRDMRSYDGYAGMFNINGENSMSIILSEEYDILGINQFYVTTKSTTGEVKFYKPDGVTLIRTIPAESNKRYLIAMMSDGTTNLLSSANN